jgi:hypothetical protein
MPSPEFSSPLRPQSWRDCVHRCKSLGRAGVEGVECCCSRSLTTLHGHQCSVTIKRRVIVGSTASRAHGPKCRRRNCSSRSQIRSQLSGPLQTTISVPLFSPKGVYDFIVIETGRFATCTTLRPSVAEGAGEKVHLLLLHAASGGHVRVKVQELVNALANVLDAAPSRNGYPMKSS